MAIKQPTAKRASDETTVDLGHIDPISVFRNMLFARECDRRESILVRQGKGIFHVGGSGHEALSVVSYLLNSGDYIFPYYRDRAIAMARGYAVDDIADDFFGNAQASSAGNNLPGHYSSRRLNIFPVATPTGSQCLPATGAAWGMRMAGEQHVVITTIGDAATRQGEFYEAYAYAVQEKLPVIFLVEDNGFGISTRTNRMLPFNLDIFDRKSYRHVDGRCVQSVYYAAAEAVRNAREGKGPMILWCEIDRLASHTSSDDHTVYRPQEEIDAMQRRDPITLFGTELERAGLLSSAEIGAMRAECAETVDVAYAAAQGRQMPTAAGCIAALYGPATPLPHPGSNLQPRSETTMVGEMNRFFADRLAADPRIVLFGQDIEDPKGGVFGFTKGLSHQYPHRVFNSPLAEATIVGTGIGLAASGYKPVFELQFVDFITPGFMQLTAQAATLRWRSNGDWSCPLVLYAPYGAYLPSGGPWHSQTNESWFAHTPGLRVAIPSTAEDVVDLFADALACEDPSLILVPKHVFRVRMPYLHSSGLGFGKAAIRRHGTDVTIVTWGNCVSIAMDAAAEAAANGVEVEVIDLRTVAPCDWPTVWESVSKTRRVIVLHEDVRTCGFGQTVISEIVTGPCPPLIADPVLLARPDVHVPYHPDLEGALLPNKTDVLISLSSMFGDRAWKV